MPSFTNCIVVLVLAVSASASSTPAFAHRRQAMAVRNAGPVVHHHAPIVRDVEPVKRQMQRRSCKPRTSSSSAVATASPVPVAVGKLGGAGDTSSSESAPTTSSTKEATSTAEATSTKAEATSTKAEATSTKAETSSSKTSSSAKSASTGSSAGSFLAGTNTGQGTFFGTGLGACGITNTASQKIVAVSQLLFDTYPGYDGANPNKNPVCGKKITATYGGKSVDVTVTDRCVACAMTDLDFTTSAFDLIADAALGRISDMTWVWA